jgi:2-amino-4-hydroxy-6-hydroxymethyldihydropteridine diphosphokinase
MLGSNLGDRIHLINKAIEQIGEQIGDIVDVSSFYHTDPWGTEDPLPYVNLALSIKTELCPEAVLQNILNIEKILGRQRNGYRNEPRSIDIDIIFYDNLIINEKDLIVPHPRMHLRRFVLVPLCEIEPDFIHPSLNQNISELLNACEDNLGVELFETAS